MFADILRSGPAVGVHTVVAAAQTTDIRMTQMNLLLHRVVLRAADPFGALLATGIVSWIVFQAMINLGGITTAIPFTGVPLPFVSYGGSSMFAVWVAVGLLQSIRVQRPMTA